MVALHPPSPGTATERRGTTLIELLVYVAIFGVVINVASVTFVQSMRICTLATSTLDSLTTLQAIQEAFTRDAHEAIRVIDELGSFTTGEQSVVLELPSTGNAVRTFCAYSLIDTDRLCRFELESRAGEWTIVGAHSFPVDLSDIRLASSISATDGCRMLTLSVWLKTREPAEGRLPSQTIHATIRSAQEVSL